MKMRGRGKTEFVPLDSKTKSKDKPNPFEGKEKKEAIKISSEELYEKKQAICQKAHQFFEEYSDYVDPKSSLYKDQNKAKDKIEDILSLYFQKLMDFQKSYEPLYLSLRSDPERADRDTWRAVEEEYAGCGKESELGLLLLTLGEVMTSANIKKWYFIRVLNLSKAYLEFGTIYGQLYSVGLLKNLVASKQITGYQSNELYALSNEVNRQAFAYNEALYRRGSFDLNEFLRSHEDIKKGFTERLHQFIEEVRVRRL